MNYSPYEVGKKAVGKHLPPLRQADSLYEHAIYRNVIPQVCASAHTPIYSTGSVQNILCKKYLTHVFVHFIH